MRTIEAGNARIPDVSPVLKPIARLILLLEPVWMAVVLFTFWYPSPDRDPYMVLLIGIPIAMAARFVLYHRLWTHTPLDFVFIAFILLMIFNVRFAPYTSRTVNFGRPLMGIALCLYFADFARAHRNLNGLLVGSIVIGVLVGFLALTGSQWNSKSDQMKFILNAIPRFTQFPAAEGGFNANEIAGAIAWVTPLLAGIALWSAKPLLRWLAAISFAILFFALFLGQSRFALAGTILALALMTPLVIRSWRWRTVAWVALALVIGLEVLIVKNVFAPPSAQAVEEARDEDSLTGRFDIWNSALHIIRDYPVTGAGLNMFRDPRVRARYPVTTFLQPVLPHTHDETLQFGSDMGIPGIILFFAIYGVAGWMLFQAYRKSDHRGKVMAAAVAGGLVAHAFFGLGDAITVWDRFAFLLWWLLALACAQYVLSLMPDVAEAAILERAVEA